MRGKKKDGKKEKKKNFYFKINFIYQLFFHKINQTNQERNTQKQRNRKRSRKRRRRRTT